VNTIADYIEGSNAIISTIEGDNATIDYINCVRLHATSNIIAGSNLAILNTFVNKPCPFPGEANYFGFNDEGWIHSSWIHTDPDMMELLEKFWNIAAAGWDIFDAVADVYRYFNPGSEELTDALKDALTEALNDGTIRVDWDALNNKPFFASKITKDTAFKGDVYFDESKSIYSLNSSYITTGLNGNMSMISTTGRDKLLDVGSREAWLKSITSSNIITSNMTVTSNLDVTNINTNNIIGGNVNVVSQLRVGDFYVNSTGLFLGDPSNPFLSKQVLDSQGNYVGTIPKSQITDLEGFSLNALTDGTLAWAGYGNENNALNDIFAFQQPLFNI
jgi:hypothetical protein